MIYKIHKYKNLDEVKICRIISEFYGEDQIQNNMKIQDAVSFIKDGMFNFGVNSFFGYY